MFSRSHVWTCFGAAAFLTAPLLWATTSSANTSVVEVLTCQQSSQGARLTIELKGKAAKDVQLILSTIENRQVQSLSLTDSGEVVLPPLAPGKYLVSASAAENLGASICVEISDKKPAKASSLFLVLQILPANALTWDQLLPNAESKTPTERMERFKGVVFDPSGAVVSGTVIQIFPKGSRGDVLLMNVTTDIYGHFDVSLEDGI